MTPYVDMHCDTLMQAWLKHKKDIDHFPKAMVDVERLEQGNSLAQFFAVFMPPVTLKKYMGPFFPKDDVYIDKLLKIFETTMQEHSDTIAPCRTYSELESNRSAKRISAILTLEDGRAVDSKMEKLDDYFNRGIRLISLTWNQPNCFGNPNSSDPELMQKGLTEFGKDAVKHMQELGMLVDVSHLSDGGFNDVAELCSGPFVASHSNCRALSFHSRNMTDDMIRTLASHGGVMGVNFGPQFLTDDPKSKESTIPLIAAQLRHMIDVGNVECAAIGTDFDGISGNLQIASPNDMPKLFESLAVSGFTADEIEHIAWKNTCRVIKDVFPE